MTLSSARYELPTQFIDQNDAISASTCGADHSGPGARTELVYGYPDVPRGVSPRQEQHRHRLAMACIQPVTDRTSIRSASRIIDALAARRFSKRRLSPPFTPLTDHTRPAQAATVAAVAGPPNPFPPRDESAGHEFSHQRYISTRHPRHFRRAVQPRLSYVGIEGHNCRFME